MAEAPIGPSSQRVGHGQVREALDRLEVLVVDGLKHGFFDYSIACEVGNGGKRHLVIRAGKSHKFTIRAEIRPLIDRRSLRWGRPRCKSRRSSVIGGNPRAEVRSTERRGTAREVFGEIIARSKRQPER